MWNDPNYICYRFILRFDEEDDDAPVTVMVPVFDIPARVVAPVTPRSSSL